MAALNIKRKRLASRAAQYEAIPRDGYVVLPLNLVNKEFGCMASVLATPIDTKAVPSATELLINNRWVESESGETFATINPSTGQEICQVAAADAIDVDLS